MVANWVFKLCKNHPKEELKLQKKIEKKLLGVHQNRSIFATLLNKEHTGLSRGVMVAQEILVLSVWVRILAGQQYHIQRKAKSCKLNDLQLFFVYNQFLLSFFQGDKQK